MNMPFPSREQVESIRKNYPPGTRVMLDNMNDPYSPVESGIRGTVRYVDDAGTLAVAWDNGRSLSLIPGEDSFRKLTQQEIIQEQGMKMGEMNMKDRRKFRDRCSQYGQVTKLNGRYSACGQAAVSAVGFGFLPVFRAPVLQFASVFQIHHPLHGFEASHLDSKVLEKVKSCSFTYFMVSSQPVRTAKGETYNGYYSHF